MEDPEVLARSILEWAERDPRISAVIATGSRGRGERVDEYSDFDLEIITPQWQELSADPSWVHNFGDVLLCMSFDQIDSLWPAPKLVVYEQGRKCDFMIAGPERLKSMIDDGLDSLYNRGYTVLFDRDGITDKLPAPTGLPTPKLPSAAQFHETVEEFWYEATQIPVYIMRADLWVVKFRDNTTKEDLLTMLEWYAATDPDSPPDTWHIGHRMSEWLPAEIWDRVRQTYGGMSADESWRSLDATVALFAEISETVSQRCGFDSPTPLATRARRLIDTYRNPHIPT